MLNFKNHLNWPVAAAFLGAASLFASCDSAIYEDLPICENSRHAVRFVWDNNMLSSDAFRGNVHSVAVYGFDADDKLAFVLEENGDAIRLQLMFPTLRQENIPLWPGVVSITLSKTQHAVNHSSSPMWR